MRGSSRGTASQKDRTSFAKIRSAQRGNSVTILWNISHGEINAVVPSSMVPLEAKRGVRMTSGWGTPALPTYLRSKSRRQFCGYKPEAPIVAKFCTSVVELPSITHPSAKYCTELELNTPQDQSSTSLDAKTLRETCTCGWTPRRAITSSMEASMVAVGTTSQHNWNCTNT